MSRHSVSTRRGVILHAVLWALVIAGGASALISRDSLLTIRASQNRIDLARAGWAATACEAIATARRSSADSVALAPDLWCSVELRVWGDRLNLNVADSGAIAALLAQGRLDVRTVEQVTAALISSRREMRSFSTMADVRARVDPPLEAWVQLDSFAAVDGPAAINLNVAPVPVLMTVPGMTNELAEELRFQRLQGNWISGFQDLSSSTSGDRRSRVLSAFSQAMQTAVTDSAVLILRAEGRVGKSNMSAVVESVLVPVQERWRITRRRTW